jgi:dTDP-4-amino-4,6-dideoxygalactose transaminase
MVGPILSLGAAPVSYKVNTDLSIDFDDLQRRVTPRTKSVIIVHFFGVQQELTAIREWCDRAGYSLVEDCAHCLFSAAPAPPIGRIGDFAVGSLVKFFPTFDGGCLVSFRREISRAHATSRGVAFQSKALLDTMERAADWSSSSMIRGVWTLARATRSGIKRLLPGVANTVGDAAPSSASGGLDYEAEWETANMSAPSKLLLRFADQTRIVERRCRAFGAYSEGLANLRGGTPFLRTLPEGAIPYVFPFVLADPERSFPALWAAGVPMYRWEEVDEVVCEISANYKRSLVQFPCHQELTDHQLQWLIDSIRRVLA